MVSLFLFIVYKSINSSFEYIVEMLISDEELAAERIPFAARDYCAHLLVDLNRCRRRTLYMPFKCTDEKHEYEQCLYKE